jgi:hypothetical protein
VSAVIPRFSLTIRLMRFAGTRIARASLLMLISSSFRSPSRILPGWSGIKLIHDNFRRKRPTPGPADTKSKDQVRGGMFPDLAPTVKAFSARAAAIKDGRKMEFTVRATDGFKNVDGQRLISHEQPGTGAALTV